MCLYKERYTLKVKRSKNKRGMGELKELRGGKAGLMIRCSTFDGRGTNQRSS